jgi:hypothetical protein
LTSRLPAHRTTRRTILHGVCVLPFLQPLLYAANVKLYLRDGSYQLVREYSVMEDRVKYYSIERSDWEEIPLELVDLKKTEVEKASREEEDKERVKAVADEDKAEREVRREIKRIPADPGVYRVEGEQVTAIKQAEAKVVNNKGRHVLKMMSPVPMVSDKSWLELDGLHSPNVVKESRPEFYFRLASEERFGMVRMGEHKGNRVVEKLTIVPVVKEVAEEPDLVDTFRQQVGDQLYKIWPEKPLAVGEYALVEYTEGKVNMQVWDFAVK